MTLETTYLGLRLRNPLVAASSPVSEDLDQLQRLQDAGLAGVVLRSFFTDRATDRAPAQSGGIDDYTRHLARVRERLEIPVIASLNGTAPDDWVQPAKRIEAAGADALELNVFYLPADLSLTAAEVEESHLHVLRAVRGAIHIPVAVKMSPFYTNAGNVAGRYAEAGADGLVLFNRFYQPDLELESGRAFSHLLLSTESDLRLPLRWIGLLHGHVVADLAASGGIETGHDVAKLVAVGARVTMLCSVIMRRGVEAVPAIEAELRTWLDVCGCGTVEELWGSMSPARRGDPLAFERAQYVETISRQLRLQRRR